MSIDAKQGYAEASKEIEKRVEATKARLFEHVNLSAGFVGIILIGFGLISDGISLTPIMKVFLGVSLGSFTSVILLYPIFVLKIGGPPITVTTKGRYYIKKEPFKQYIKNASEALKLKFLSPILFAAGLVNLAIFGILAIAN